MAEGGIKVVDDSELMFDHECTHLAHACRQEAVKSCKECKTLLCQVCLTHHDRYLKTHTLTNIESLSKSQIANVGKIPTMLKCLNHPDRDIEMYCGRHDMVYCSLCVAKNHRSCKGVKEIQDVPHKTNLSKLQKLVVDLTKVNQRIQDTKLAQKRRAKDLKSIKASILKEIKALRKRMNDHLDILEDQLIAELDAEQSILEDEANKEVKETNGISTAIEQQKPNMTATYDPTQMFILEKVAQFALVNADKYLRRTASTKRQTLVFEHNAGLLDTIEEANRIGKLVRRDINPTRTQPRPYTMKSVSQTNRITFADHLFSNFFFHRSMFGANDRNLIITDMCQHSDGTILLIDEFDERLKRLNDRLRVNDIYIFNARPKGICLKSPTEVAVLLSNGTITFIEVGRSLSYQGAIKLPSTDTDKTMKGLAYCSNRFWTLGENAIYIFTQSGSLVKTKDRDTHGEIFQELKPHGIAVSNDGSMVFVTAGGDRVVVFNKYGDFIREFRDERLYGTYGICITCDDIVVVSGNFSRNVLMFDLEGQCLGELISRKELTNELYNLQLMCFDNQKRRLLVSVRYRHKIVCFDLDQ